MSDKNCSPFFYWARAKQGTVQYRAQTPTGERVIAVEGGPKRWANCEKTLRALSATLVEAVDKDGKVIAAFTFDSDDEDEKPEAAPRVVAKTTDEKTLALFGQLLADAYKHANTTAFAKMVELADVQNARMMGLEKSLSHLDKMHASTLAQLRRTQRDLDEAEVEAERAATQAPELGDGIGAVLGAFANGMANGKAEAAPAPAPKAPKGKAAS